MDKNTIGAQALANRTAEDVCQLQNEVNMYNDKLNKMDKQIQIERELVNYLTTRTKEMKIQLIEDTVNLFFYMLKESDLFYNRKKETF